MGDAASQALRLRASPLGIPFLGCGREPIAAYRVRQYPVRRYWRGSETGNGRAGGHCDDCRAGRRATEASGSPAALDRSGPSHCRGHTRETPAGARKDAVHFWIRQSPCAAFFLLERVFPSRQRPVRRQGFPIRLSFNAAKGAPAPKTRAKAALI